MKTLLTEAGSRLSGIPWNRYPRPQLRRAEWLCLNGRWRFAAAGREGEIRVPFCPESALSGAFPVKIGEKMTYSRRFTLPE
ncbi:MAG: glycoside hydrolase family 2 protein, partial [bacterium]